MKASANAKTYKFTMSDGKTTRMVSGKGRQSACMKLTGMRVKAALETGQIKNVELMCAKQAT